MRHQQTDELAYSTDQSAGVTVHCGQRTGTASTTDLTDEGLQATLNQALTIARFTEVDACAGLADAGRMARDWPAMSLCHPWPLQANEAEDLGRQIEAAAMAYDNRMQQIEGARVVTSEGFSAYGNSHGFVGVEHTTRHAMSCTAIAADEQGMQREAAFTQARSAADLDTAEATGRLAAERAVGCLGARTLPTTTAPVLFVPRMARSLWGHFLGAISGGNLYRDATFLKDRIDTRIMSDQVQLNQRPHLKKGLASTGFDGDGVATCDRELVEAGTLRGYLLSAYSARRLGWQTTGNAGGVFNLDVTPGTHDFDALVAGMGRGLVVTQLMGQGVNLVTGDYSRGASGYWVENGEPAYPVENVTIAGNLADMFMQIKALGSDVDAQASILTPSVCIDNMTIAGQ